jgi:L-threonylcarbamoyladenylate synthase
MINEDFIEDAENAIGVLQEGGTILYPTDTIWGIGCDATDANAVEKVFAIKNRPATKSFVVLVASERDILQYTAAPDLAVFDYLQTVRKPTTVIYDLALGIADNVCSDDGSVAIRICSDEFCTYLLKRFRKPIVSTSANISGRPSPQNFPEIDEAIKNGVDYVVRHRQNDFTKSAASSVIRWVNGAPEIIRP